jgi:HK97 family phage major capsid protein
MSATTTQLTEQRDQALAAADAIVSTAERGKRSLTRTETENVDRHLATANELGDKIEAAKRASVDIPQLRATVDAARAKATPQAAYKTHHAPAWTEKKLETVHKSFSREYHSAFWDSYLGKRGPVTAALEEGAGGPSGGYAVPVFVDKTAVPLGVADSAVRRLATVIPTRSDLKTPQVTTRGAAQLKTEGSAMTATAPALAQFTLSAFFLSTWAQTSLELMQDVDTARAFWLDDASKALTELEEGYFITGTGSGQPQGLIGNVGAGVTDEPDSNSNAVHINGTLDLIGTLKDTYSENASWLMSRATSIVLRKGQLQAGLFVPLFTRENGQDYLHGYPVAYSGSMPSASRGNTPILFGDFKSGYLIGDRGGATFARVLDQTLDALSGIFDLLLYRRTDGRVRRSEAIQSYTVAAS